MGRAIAAILLVVFLVVGAGFVATTAYQIGVSTAITTTVTETGATVVTPVVPGPGYVYPAYGWGHGWGFGGPGFGFLGFLGTLLFIFLIIGLIRAVFFRGSGRGWGGPGGYGGWGPRGQWEPGRSGVPRQAEEWHRQMHDADATHSDAGRPPTSDPGSTGLTGTPLLPRAPGQVPPGALSTSRRPGRGHGDYHGRRVRPPHPEPLR